MGMILDFYGTWDAAFDFFNKKLFAGQLPDVAFTVKEQQHSHAYFSPGRYVTRDGNKLPEISMNANSLERPDIESMSTLVHEMTHHWQYQFGKPGRGKYHNLEWAAKMREIGLAPDSATNGEIGTGDKVTHKIVSEGPFAMAFDEWQELGLVIGWHGHRKLGLEGQQVKAKRASKTKYTCPECKANVWGKPGLVLYDDCGEQFEEEII